MLGCLLIWSILLAKSNISADECGECKTVTLEAKAAYFIFSNNKMREIYDNGGYQLQLSGSYPLIDIWHLYGSVGFIGASGKSLHFKEKTKFYQIPIDIGIKPILNIASCLNWTMAFGPRFFYAHQRNHSEFVPKNVRKSNVGMFVNTGIDFTPARNCHFTLFGEYSYQPIHPSSSKHGTHSRTIQVGGFSLGAGFGYTF